MISEETMDLEIIVRWPKFYPLPLVESPNIFLELLQFARIFSKERTSFLVLNFGRTGVKGGVYCKILKFFEFARGFSAGTTHFWYDEVKKH